MKTIIAKQKQLQTLYAEHRDMKDPSKLRGSSVGELYDYIVSMQRFLNAEIEEILLEMVNGNRAVHKPWSKDYEPLRERKPVGDLEGEAMDMLCFAMNICIACGLDENNIDEIYQKIYDKNINRIKNNY